MVAYLGAAEGHITLDLIDMPGACFTFAVVSIRRTGKNRWETNPICKEATTPFFVASGQRRLGPFSLPALSALSASSGLSRDFQKPAACRSSSRKRIVGRGFSGCPLPGQTSGLFLWSKNTRFC